MVVSCHKDTPTEGGYSDTTEMWPVKKISRIVHCVGTLDYLTYDFTWDGNLLKDKHYCNLGYLQKDRE